MSRFVDTDHIIIPQLFMVKELMAASAMYIYRDLGSHCANKTLQSEM